MAHRYAKRHPDLADLCLIRMSELYPRHAVITVDEDTFRIYRRKQPKGDDSAALPTSKLIRSGPTI